MHDLTEQISRIIQKAGIQTGMVNVFNVGSTGAIGAIEFEPGLQRDLPQLLNNLIPPSRDYGHERPGMMATDTPISRQPGLDHP
jgi:thiamine phosphate synthase YjbQ (UPF0047 family)